MRVMGGFLDASEDLCNKHCSTCLNNHQLHKQLPALVIDPVTVLWDAKCTTQKGANSARCK